MSAIKRSSWDQRVAGLGLTLGPTVVTGSLPVARYD